MTRLRLNERISDLPKGVTLRKEYTDIVKAEEDSLQKDVSRCKWLLLISSFSLVTGSFCVAIAFAGILSDDHGAS